MDPTEPEQPSTSRDTVIIHAAESTSQVVGSSKRRLRSLPPKKSKGDEGKFVLYLPGLRTRLLNESSVRLSSPSSVPPSPSRRNLNSSPRRSSPREQPARATVIVSPTRNPNLSPSAGASPLTSPSSMLKQLHLTKSTTMSPPANSTTSPSLSSSAIRMNGTCTPPKQNLISSSAIQTNGTCTPPRQNLNSSSGIRTNGTCTPPGQNLNSSAAIRTNGTCTPPRQNCSSSSAIRTNGTCTPPRKNFNSSPPVPSSTTSPSSSSSTWVRTKGTWTPPREDLNSSPSVTSSSPQDSEKSPILRLLLTKDAKVSPSKYWKLKQQLAKNLTSSESAVSSTTSPVITMEQLAISLRIVTPPRNSSQRSARSSRGQNWRSAMKKKNSIVGKPTKKRGTCPKCHWILTVCQCNKKERN